MSATAIVVVILFAVALQGRRQRSVVIGVATSVVVAATIVALDGTVDWGGLVTRIPLVVMSLALGDTVRTRRQLRAAAREREAHEAWDREQESRRRIVNERLRIARELHDTLAHALVAINVRAGVAERLLASQDPSVAFGDIKVVSATALRDLRATLSLLRESDACSCSASPRFEQRLHLAPLVLPDEQTQDQRYVPERNARELGWRTPASRAMAANAPRRLPTASSIRGIQAIGIESPTDRPGS